MKSGTGLQRYQARGLGCKSAPYRDFEVDALVHLGLASEQTLTQNLGVSGRRGSDAGR